jgi:hypothetical protein
MNAKISENNSKISEENTKASEENVKIIKENILASEANITALEEAASISANNALISEQNAKTSETNAAIYESNAKESENNAKISEQNAKVSEINAEEQSNIAITKASEASMSASTSIENAQIATDKAIEASDSAILSQSYAVGGTNTRTDEDINNSKYYYIQAKAVSDSIDGSFLPMGTIEFAQLSTSEKDTGYVYHISDEFITDDTFKSGAGISYPAGTNVYYTSDGYWDCFTGRFVTIEEYESLTQTVVDLIKRIEILEGYNVLEITE